MQNDEHPDTAGFAEAVVKTIVAKWLWAPNLTGDDIGIGLESKALKSEHLTPEEKLIRELLQNIIDRIRKGKDTVKCVIRIRELYGKDKEDFLAALGIDQLIPNLGASEESRYKRAAKEVLAKESILVLYVEDYHTEGLNGPEYSHQVKGDGSRNYSALVRSSARSRQSYEGSGGQHGVGKSVQTTSSDVGTVFYYSNPDDHDENRLFGVCTIDSHTFNGPKTGKATFGVKAWEEDDFKDHTRESVRGSDADRIAGQLGFRERGPDDTGTSICIPVFDIPGSKVRDPVKLAKQFHEDIRKWFAPALSGATTTKLEAYIQSPEDPEPVRVKMDEKDGEPTLFAKLVAEMPKWKDHLGKDFAKVGDIVSRSFRYKLPGGGKAEAVVVAMRVPEGTDRSMTTEGGPAKVGIYRSSGMIVEFMEVKEQSLAEAPYIALVAAGKGIKRPGDSPGRRDEDSDIFLASTEPPAHDYFDKQASKAIEKYHAGPVIRTLNDFRKGIKKELRGIAEVQTSDDEKTSDYLASLTPFGKVGKKRTGPPKPGQLTVNSRTQRRTDEEWVAPTKVIAAFKAPDFSHWGGRVEVHAGSEHSNRPSTDDRLDISGVSVRDGEGRNLMDLGMAEVLSEDGRDFAVKLQGVDSKEVNIVMRARRPSGMSLPADYISPLVVSTLTKGGDE